MRQLHLQAEVELLRRTSLTGWVALIPEKHAFLRLVVGVLVSLSVLVLTLIRNPYKHNEDQLLAVTGHVMLVMVSCRAPQSRTSSL